MPLFSHHGYNTSRSTSNPIRRRFFKKDPDRVAGGYKAALSNPHTTRSGRKHAQQELKAMGRGSESHISIMTRIRRTLGIHSTPRTQRRRRNLL